jgi:hypothetical protein
MPRYLLATGLHVHANLRMLTAVVNLRRKRPSPGLGGSKKLVQSKRAGGGIGQNEVGEGAADIETDAK